MEQNTPQVIVTPKEYYVTRRMDGHADWRLAFWRELFQNSTDAGANVFDIKVSEAPAIGAFGRETESRNIIRVMFKDNGTGMSLETLRDVFFSPGKSTKNTSDTVGGFGTARLMLCFSQARYAIDTNGLRAEGDGSEYIIGESFKDDPSRIDKGCRFTIDIELKENYYSNSSHKMIEKLHDYLDMSQISGNIYLNDELLKNKLYRGKTRRELILPNGEVFGTVHLSSGEKAIRNKVIVRQNGAMMFTRTGGGRSQIIVEIDPKHGRLALAENRDSLRQPYLDAFDDMIREVTIDENSALKDKSGKKLINISGPRGTITLINKPKKSINININNDGQAHDAEVSFNEIEESDYVGGMVQPINFRREQFDIVHYDMPDIMMSIEDLKKYPKMKKVVSRYDPRNWGVARPEVGRVGVQAHQTLAAWIVACENAVKVLQSIAQSDDYREIKIVPGWLFPKPEEQYFVDRYVTTLTEARCENIEGSTYSLLLNPITTDGKAKYHLSKFTLPNDKNDETMGMAAMISIACHEVTHMVNDYHNESFASLYTHIMGKIDSRQVWVEMQEAMKKVAKIYKELAPVNKTQIEKDNKHGYSNEIDNDEFFGMELTS